MGKSIPHSELEKQQNDGYKFQQRQMITPHQYELFQLSTNNVSQNSIMSKNYQNKKQNQYVQDYQQMDFGHKKRKKKKRKKLITEEQINARDIIDIVVIILLVLILGVSLFRVVLQVQVQYKLEQQRNKHSPNKHIKNQGLSEYERLNRKNNPNQNYDQTTQKSNKKHNDQSLNTIVKNASTLHEVLSTQCREHIDKLLKQRGHLYDFKVTYEQLKIKSRVQVFKQNMNTQISKQQFADAIDLLGLIHQTQYQGQLNIQGDPCQNTEIKKQRLQKVLIKQAEEWNMNYDLDVYHYRQMRFCLVVNSYNNAKNGLIYRNIDSILQQNYTNYHVVYTDDNSKDQTGTKIMQYLKQKNVPQNLFHVIINQQQKGMMENIFNAIHQHCQNGQIAVMVDGDDSLIGTNVLSLLNAIYQKEKPALLWANFVTIINNQHANLGFSRDYPPKNKKEGSFRKVKVFLSSHLKTFFVDLFKKINPSDLQTNDGKFYRGASDTAMMMPMLQMANPRIKYLPELLYEYRYDTGQTGNSVNRIPQKEALKKIFSSTSYKKLTDFQFVQKAIDSALDLSQKQTQQLSVDENQIKSLEVSLTDFESKAKE